MILIKNSLIVSGDLENLFSMQESIELHLAIWEEKHKNYTHTNEIQFIPEGFLLDLKIYEIEQNFQNN